jgi:hypothetical protein
MVDSMFGEEELRFNCLSLAVNRSDVGADERIALAEKYYDYVAYGKKKPEEGEAAAPPSLE